VFDSTRDNTERGTAGVFLQTKPSLLKKCLRFQNEYNKVEIKLGNCTAHLALYKFLSTHTVQLTLYT
jgi:hypothetical protein